MKQQLPKAGMPYLRREYLRGEEGESFLIYASEDAFGFSKGGEESHLA